jgi:SPP1 family predicted phage head-tail adaptor
MPSLPVRHRAAAAPRTIPAGALSRPFVLEIPLESPDGFGGVVRTWQAGPQLWGALQALSGGERRRADRPEQAVTHKVVLRHRDGVTGAMRLTCGPRRFAIRAAYDPDGRRRELHCLVEEIGP